MKEYRQNIDLAKGIGIILVIIGHGLLNNFVINVFHMPLFFFLAGFTFTPVRWDKYNIFIIKKLNRIFIPYVFFTFLTAILEILIGKLQPNSPLNGPLWFLETLFISLVIYSILHFLKEKHLHAICFLLPLLVYILAIYTECSKILPFHLLRCLEAVFYIHIGWCYNKYYYVINKNRFLFFVVALVIFIMGIFLSYNYYDVHTALFVNMTSFTYNIVLSHISAISGVMIVVFLSEIIEHINFVNWFGRNSLVVLCVHFPLIERLNYLCFYFFSELGVSMMVMKAVLVIFSYIITIVFCSIAILFFRKYFPKFTGYSNLIPL